MRFGQDLSSLTVNPVRAWPCSTLSLCNVGGGARSPGRNGRVKETGDQNGEDVWTTMGPLPLLVCENLLYLKRLKHFPDTCHALAEFVKLICGMGLENVLAILGVCVVSVVPQGQWAGPLWFNVVQCGSV